MFGIGGTELLIIAVLGLLLFGPDKLPEIARTVSRFMRDFKRYQSMMESTFKAEMLAFEDMAKDDGTKKPAAKKTGQDFNKKVAGSQFAKVEPVAKKAEAEKADAEATEAEKIEAGKTEAEAGDKTASGAAACAAAEAALTPEDKRATTPPDAPAFAEKPSAQGEEEAG